MIQSYERGTILERKHGIRLEVGSYFNEVIGRFLNSLDIKRSSKQTYKKGFWKFLLWLKSKEIQNPTREDILTYKGYLQTQGISSLTLSSYMVVVRKFFEWAEGMKLYPNIAKGIKGAKRVRGFRKESLTVDQVKELLSRIDRSSPQGKRDYAMLNLMIRTGLRTVEIIRADIGDIRQKGGEAVLWIQGKGRDAKDDFVLLTQETLSPIRNYLQTRNKIEDTSPLFSSLSDRNNGKRLTTQSVRKIVKKHLRDIGIDSKRLSAHSLRHTAITLSLLGGATIQEARVLGRHADINTTLIYAHNINRLVNAPERKIDAVLSDKIETAYESSF
ncbi:Tyrosine recombinase XerD [subsurface metagenome]